jgi:hypothetical protein
MGVVESEADPPAVVSTDLDDGPWPWRALDGGDLIRKDPQVAIEQAALFSGSKGDGLFHETK